MTSVLTHSDLLNWTVPGRLRKGVTLTVANGSTGSISQLVTIFQCLCFPKTNFSGFDHYPNNINVD